MDDERWEWKELSQVVAWSEEEGWPEWKRNDEASDVVRDLQVFVNSMEKNLEFEAVFVNNMEKDLGFEASDCLSPTSDDEEDLNKYKAWDEHQVDWKSKSEVNEAWTKKALSSTAAISLHDSEMWNISNASTVSQDDHILLLLQHVDKLRRMYKYEHHVSHSLRRYISKIEENVNASNHLKDALIVSAITLLKHSSTNQLFTAIRSLLCQLASVDDARLYVIANEPSDSLWTMVKLEDQDDTLPNPSTQKLVRDVSSCLAGKALIHGGPYLSRQPNKDANYAHGFDILCNQSGVLCFPITTEEGGPKGVIEIPFQVPDASGDFVLDHIPPFLRDFLQVFCIQVSAALDGIATPIHYALQSHEPVDESEESEESKNEEKDKSTMKFRAFIASLESNDILCSKSSADLCDTICSFVQRVLVEHFCLNDCEVAFYLVDREKRELWTTQARTSSCLTLRAFNKAIGSVGEREEKRVHFGVGVLGHCALCHEVSQGPVLDASFPLVEIGIPVVNHESNLLGVVSIIQARETEYDLGILQCLPSLADHLKTIMTRYEEQVESKQVIKQIHEFLIKLRELLRLNMDAQDETKENTSVLRKVFEFIARELQQIVPNGSAALFLVDSQLKKLLSLSYPFEHDYYRDFEKAIVANVIETGEAQNLQEAIYEHSFFNPNTDSLPSMSSRITSLLCIPLCSETAFNMSPFNFISENLTTSNSNVNSSDFQDSMATTRGRNVLLGSRRHLSVQGTPTYPAIGAILLLNKASVFPGAKAMVFTPYEQEICTDLARQIGHMLLEWNRQLLMQKQGTSSLVTLEASLKELEKLNESVDESKWLKDLVTRLNHPRSMNGVILEGCNVLSEVFEIERVLIYFLASEHADVNNSLWVLRSDKDPLLLSDEKRGLAGYVIDTKVEVETNDATKHSKYHPLVDSNTYFTTKTCYCTPFYTTEFDDRRVFGCVEFAAQGVHAFEFTSDDKAKLQRMLEVLVPILQKAIDVGHTTSQLLQYQQERLIHDRNIQEILTSQTNQLESYQHLVSTLSICQSTIELMRAIKLHLPHMLQSDTASLALLEDSEDMNRKKMWTWNSEKESKENISMNGTIESDCYLRQTVVQRLNVNASITFGLPHLTSEPGQMIGCVLCVPVFSTYTNSLCESTLSENPEHIDNKVIGVLEVAHVMNKEFSKNTQRYLECLSTEISLILEKQSMQKKSVADCKALRQSLAVQEAELQGIVQAQRQREAQISQLRFFKELTMQYQRELDIDDMLQSVLQCFRTVYPSFLVYIFVVQESTEEFWTLPSTFSSFDINESTKAYPKIHLPLHEGILGKIFRQGQLVNINNIVEYKQTHHATTLGIPNEWQFGSMILAPTMENLISGQCMNGILLIGHHDINMFDASFEAFCQDCGPILGMKLKTSLRVAHLNNDLLQASEWKEYYENKWHEVNLHLEHVSSQSQWSVQMNLLIEELLSKNGLSHSLDVIQNRCRDMFDCQHVAVYILDKTLHQSEEWTKSGLHPPDPLHVVQNQFIARATTLGIVLNSKEAIYAPFHIGHKMHAGLLYMTKNRTLQEDSCFDEHAESKAAIVAKKIGELLAICYERSDLSSNQATALKKMNELKEHIDDQDSLLRKLHAEGKAQFQLMQVGAKLSTCVKIQEMWSLIRERVPSIFQVEWSTLYVVDSATQELYTMSGAERIPFGKGILGSAVFSTKILNLDRVVEDGRYDPHIDGANTRTMLMSSLMNPTNKEVYGLIVLANKCNDERFTEKDVEMLSVLHPFVLVNFHALVTVERLQLQMKNKDSAMQDCHRDTKDLVSYIDSVYATHDLNGTFLDILSGLSSHSMGLKNEPPDDDASRKSCFHSMEAFLCPMIQKMEKSPHLDDVFMYIHVPAQQSSSISSPSASSVGSSSSTNTWKEYYRVTPSSMTKLSYQNNSTLAMLQYLHTVGLHTVLSIQEITNASILQHIHEALGLPLKVLTSSATNLFFFPFIHPVRKIFLGVCILRFSTEWHFLAKATLRQAIHVALQRRLRDEKGGEKQNQDSNENASTKETKLGSCAQQRNDLSSKPIFNFHDEVYLEPFYLLNEICSGICLLWNACQEQQEQNLELKFLVEEKKSYEKNMKELHERVQNSDKLILCLNALFHAKSSMLFKLVGQQLSELLQCDAGVLYCLSADGKNFRTQDRLDSEKEILFPVNKGVLGRVFLKDHLLNFSNTRMVDEISGGDILSALYSIISDMDGNKIGILCAVGKTSNNIFTSQDELVLQEYARVVAAAIERYSFVDEMETKNKRVTLERDNSLARIKEALQEKEGLQEFKTRGKRAMEFVEHYKNHLQNYQEFLQSILNIDEIEEMLRKMEAYLLKLKGVMSVRMYMVSQENKQMRLLSKDDLDRSGSFPLREKQTHDISKGVTGSVALTGREHIVSTIKGNPLFDSDVDGCLSNGSVLYFKPISSFTQGVCSVVVIECIQESSEILLGILECFLMNGRQAVERMENLKSFTSSKVPKLSLDPERPPSGDLLEISAMREEMLRFAIHLFRDNDLGSILKHCQITLQRLTKSFEVVIYLCHSNQTHFRIIQEGSQVTDLPFTKIQGSEFWNCFATQSLVQAPVLEANGVKAVVVYVPILYEEVYQATKKLLGVIVLKYDRTYDERMIQIITQFVDFIAVKLMGYDVKMGPQTTGESNESKSTPTDLLYINNKVTERAATTTAFTYQSPLKQSPIEVRSLPTQLNLCPKTLQLMSEMLAIHTWPELHHKLPSLLRRLFESSQCRVYQKDMQTHQVFSVAKETDQRIVTDEKQILSVFESGLTLTFDQVHDESMESDEMMLSYLLFPVRVNSEIQMVVSLASKMPHFYTAEHERSLKQLSQQVLLHVLKHCDEKAELISMKKKWSDDNNFVRQVESRHEKFAQCIKELLAMDKSVSIEELEDMVSEDLKQVLPAVSHVIIHPVDLHDDGVKPASTLSNSITTERVFCAKNVDIFSPGYESRRREGRKKLSRRTDASLLEAHEVISIPVKTFQNKVNAKIDIVLLHGNRLDAREKDLLHVYTGILGFVIEQFNTFRDIKTLQDTLLEKEREMRVHHDAIQRLDEVQAQKKLLVKEHDLSMMKLQKDHRTVRDEYHRCQKELNQLKLEANSVQGLEGRLLRDKFDTITKHNEEMKVEIKGLRERCAYEEKSHRRLALQFEVEKKEWSVERAELRAQCTELSHNLQLTKSSLERLQTKWHTTKKFETKYKEKKMLWKDTMRKHAQAHEDLKHAHQKERSRMETQLVACQGKETYLDDCLQQFKKELLFSQGQNQLLEQDKDGLQRELEKMKLSFQHESEGKARSSTALASLTERLENSEKRSTELQLLYDIELAKSAKDKINMQRMIHRINQLQQANDFLQEQQQGFHSSFQQLAQLETKESQSLQKLSGSIFSFTKTE